MDQELRQVIVHLQRVDTLKKEVEEKVLHLGEYSLKALGELLEDIGNLYLDASDEVREDIMARGNSQAGCRP